MPKLNSLLPFWLSIFLIVFSPLFVVSLDASYVDYKFFNPLKLVGHEKIRGRSDFYRVNYNAKFLINKVEKFLQGKVVKNWSYEYSELGILRKCYLKKGWKFHSYLFNGAGDIRLESYRYGKRSPYKEIFYSYLNNKLEMKKVMQHGKLHSFYRYSYFLDSGFYLETQFKGGVATRHIYYRIDDRNQVVEELHYYYGRLKKIYKLQHDSFGFLKSRKLRAITKMDAKVNPFKEDVERARP